MDMEIIGRHSLLFDDDAMLAFVNSGDALVEWHSLQIDRYDVRHLLSAPPPPRRRNCSYEPRTSDDPSIEFLIDQERYLDLPSESNQPDLEEKEEEKSPNSFGYHAIAFSYGNTDDSADQKTTDIEMEAKGYLPPFFVPGDIVMPPAEKLHQIIARTAIFVSKHGGQSEIILRVKQGDNPTFGFLMPDHHLHTYFRYLVEHPELLHPEIDEISQDGGKMGTEHNNSGNIGGALSLLGSVYGSGEDEDADDAVNASLSHDAKNMESAETAAKDESGKSIPSKKDKVPALKKNTSIIGSKRKSVKGSKKEDNSGAKEEKLRNHGIGATSKPIVEPPPELKRMVDKLVEFITRNGRQFEATLLEQDSKLERFPFLLSSNQYHPYYLKALEAAQESKVNGKSFYPGQEDLGGRGISRKGSLPKEMGISHSTSELCDVPFESDRKEKFKMVIGKSKKDAHEAEKESQECGFTVDAAAAAAILQAATKGIKSSGLRYITNTASNSHINAVRNEDGQPANSSNLQPLLPYSTGEKSEQSGSCKPSASHEVAGGDDYSNSNLTEEQKLKATRLKRAKMFVAMLKSGALPSRTGASRGSSAEPVEHGVWRSAAEGRYASQEREGSAPAVVYKSAVECNFSERQSDQQSKRKYRSESIGRKDDEEDSDREGHLFRKRRISRRSEDDENENAVEKEHRYNQEKGRHQSHSPEDNKNEGESTAENKDTKSLHSSHRSEGDDNESEGMCKEGREAKDNGRHPGRKYRSRSQREDGEVGNAVEKDRKHRRSKHRSHSSSEESDNGEESDGQDAEHKHYRSKYNSRRSQRDDNAREGAYKEERDKEHKRSHGSRSRRHESKYAVEKEDKKYRRKHSSHLSYEENGGESSGDEKEDHRSKSSHSKHKDDGHEDIYREEKDRKRSRKSSHSRHSSSESPSRHSSERHKKHRSSRTSHHSEDKHKHRHRHRKDRESHHRHKHDGASDDEHLHRASSRHPEKESLDLEEGEISSKGESKGIVSGDGKREASVDVASSEQRAPSLPSETTEVPADLRAKIRAMLMATRS
ncbi:splicing factor, suppressor of white-apricot homolog isoform X1 [Salvia splendens]|uniref:splicing factor, suppressor of white-apricot homolog isoform X1 n=2 Tax=Salvia splendens TaxID=180675 RepID=UPI001C25B21B|nr:splicing factor, suppressor of white-apricot homolog isoform X1 [Salvia splendens]